MITPIIPGGQGSGNVHLSKAGTTSIVVPAGKQYWLDWASLHYVATADVLTRFASMRAWFTSGAVTPLLIFGSLAPTASQNIYSQFGPHLVNGTGIILNTSYGGAPFCVPSGFSIGVVVDAGAPAGDDWTCDLLYRIVPNER